MRLAFGFLQVSLISAVGVALAAGPAYAQQPYQYGGGWSNGRWVGGSGGDWSNGRWNGGDYGGGWRNGRFVGSAPPGNTYAPYAPTLKSGHAGCRKIKTKKGKSSWSCP
jgi:hypothetical protein